MSDAVIGSILHGAYGDYYEQAICLKHHRLTHPGVHFKLFAASPHRWAELRVLDFSWADCFEPWTNIQKHQIDRFLQFQVLDPELQSDVLDHLPVTALAKIDRVRNQMPWNYLRSILPLQPEYQLGLSEDGLAGLSDVLERNGINLRMFDRPTIGFLWRHRAPGGAIKPFLQADADVLVKKYSRLFNRFIEEYGCHIFICGMRVPRTKENQYRIDAKYPEYGLDLPPECATHLKGLSWALELEILSRCTVCVTHPSGFSEALCIKRNTGVILVDPPAQYLAKVLWRRMPLFGLHRLRSWLFVAASRSEGMALRGIRSELDKMIHSKSSWAGCRRDRDSNEQSSHVPFC